MGIFTACHYLLLSHWTVGISHANDSIGHSIAIPLFKYNKCLDFKTFKHKNQTILFRQFDSEVIFILRSHRTEYQSVGKAIDC